VTEGGGPQSRYATEVFEPRQPAGGVPFGRYRLRERLGVGGMAVVYRASIEGPEGFSRFVVVKRMLPTLSRDPNFARMMVSEARLSALLHHPAIVQVQDFGEVSGEYFIAMELVDGYDLLTVLNHCARKNQFLPIGVAVHVCHEIASALAYAHALTDDAGKPLQIVHRDVSPSNIMVAKLGQVKLLDFGIAKAASSVRDEQTRTGTLKGKISYMSPEQAEGDNVDHRADLFALGIVLWESLTRQRLFRGEDDLRTLRLVREAKIDPPSSLRPEVDAELDAVVLKMLARRFEDRFASADEVAAALAIHCRRWEADARTLKQFLDAEGPLEARSATGDSAVAPIAAAAERPTEVEGKAVEPAPRAAPAEATPPSSRAPHATSARPATELLAPRSRRWRPTILIAAAVALTLIAWLGARGKSGRPPKTTTAAATTPSSSPGASAASVRLAISGTLGAAVFVDDREVGTVPVELALPAQASARQLVVRADGYQSFDARVPGAEDRALVVTLKRLTPPARARDGKKAGNAAAPRLRSGAYAPDRDGLKDPFPAR
jgi:serine/threonine protein kinase